MKFKELFEMPTFMARELPIDDVEVMIMSVDTLDREYDMLSATTAGDMRILSAIKKNHKSAIIGNAVTRDDGVPCIRIVLTLEFQEEEPDLGEAGGNALQVCTVVTTDAMRGAGFGYQLYKALLNKGITLASDNIQYIGGKELWKKIVRRAAKDDHSVHILQNGKYMRDKAGNIITYNGTNIPDSVIWSEDKRSKDHYYTLLVARNNSTSIIK